MKDILFDSTTDLWADWLLHRRYANDADYADKVDAVIRSYIDRVLRFAGLSDGMHLLDLGAGEGTLGLRAIDQCGASLTVTMSDISPVLLDHAKIQSANQNVSNQCNFIQTSAENLEGVPDATFDCVTSRSVLAYVADKPSAFRAMYRVLKPGGRFSIAEPIFQDEAFDASLLKKRLEVQPADHPDKGLELLHRWKSAQFPDTPEKISMSPIANFTERDLLRYAVAEGFTELHLELHIDVLPSLIKTWDVFVGASPHPWAPSLKQIMETQFSLDEQQFFEAMVRPSIEAGHPVSIDRMAYLSGRKPNLPN